ncbi:MAG: amidase family protein, partial [Paracoccaceae bacterium]
NWKGQYATGLLDAHSSWRTRADELSDSLKVSMFVGEYGIRHHRGRYYAKSQNILRRLTAAYDAMLAECDVLLLPTTPMKATPLPPADAPLSLYLQRAFEMIGNTAPFNAAGHPGMSIPCGMSNGLPIGAMLVGKCWDEKTIYQVADAFASS